MADFNDLQLDKWQTPIEPERGNAAFRIAAIVVVLLGLVAAGYFLLWRRAQPAPNDVRVHTEQAVASTPKPVAEAGETIDLPPLAQSDAIVRELVGKISSHPTVASWLTTDNLIRNFTVVVQNISSGRTPSRFLTRVKPAGTFQVIERGSDLRVDPRSFHRYDAYADAVSALDARGTARLYATLKPRIDEAYRELGYPEGNFDQVMQRAIVELLKTPVVDSTPALVTKSVVYEYADPKLQALSPAQRQFLRMGPRNVRLVQAKLREIAPLLGITVE
ncbi:MAG TPA: DUF3014 domain-containing protein [Vicinamibacterales bacterium]|jgi:hypothetical protein